MSGTSLDPLGERAYAAVVAELRQEVVALLKQIAGAYGSDWWLKADVEQVTAWEEPIGAVPLLVITFDGPFIQFYDWVELMNDALELDETSYYLELQTHSSGYFYVDTARDPALAAAVFARARFRWCRRLVQGEYAASHSELLEYFGSNPSALAQMPWRAFERLVASILANQGFRAALGPGSHDGGVDIRLYQHDAVGELLTLVQVKRYRTDRPISLDAVLALSHRVDDERANRGLFVTSSRFLPGVARWAEEKGQAHRLILADGRRVGDWCADLALAAHERYPESYSRAAAAYQTRLVAGTEPSGRGGEVLVASVGINCHYQRFALVLAETTTGALVVDLSAARVELARAAHRGTETPIVPDDWAELPINTRRGERVPHWLWKHSESAFLGDGERWLRWGHQPRPYDLND